MSRSSSVWPRARTAGVAELALVAAFDLAAELERHRLHAVADAQHRHAQLEHGLRRLVRGLLVHAGVAARQDHALQAPVGGVLADAGVADVAGMDLAVDVRLAHAAGDQLRDLGAEVEDEDLVVLHGSGQVGGARDVRAAAGGALRKARSIAVESGFEVPAADLQVGGVVGSARQREGPRPVPEFQVATRAAAPAHRAAGSSRRSTCWWALRREACRARAVRCRMPRATSRGSPAALVAPSCNCARSSRAPGPARRGRRPRPGTPARRRRSRQRSGSTNQPFVGPAHRRRRRSRSSLVRPARPAPAEDEAEAEHRAEQAEAPPVLGRRDVGTRHWRARSMLALLRLRHPGDQADDDALAMPGQHHFLAVASDRADGSASWLIGLADGNGTRSRILASTSRCAAESGR